MTVMNRSAFIAASATLAAASRTVAQAQTSGVPGGTHFVERKADFDADAFGKIVGRDAQIRQLYEAVAFKPTLLNNVKNSFNGLQFGFGYPADGIAIALAPHGPSSSYSYTDYIWTKYRIGELFDLKDAAGAPIRTNAFLKRRATADRNADPDDDKGMYQDTSIEMLQERGLIVLTCHTAVEEQARTIVKKGFAPAGSTASQVADDILTHLIAGAQVVPSMVATIAVLQATYHYTYLTPVL
jgi:intracellular sulfur oxidation DsrE/DsrF family protein